jgi:hypothetical protein
MGRLSNHEILEKVKNISDKELYDNIKRVLYEKSSLTRDINTYIQELNYLKSITSSEAQEYVNSLKDKLLKKTELEKQELLEQSEYLRIKENKELRESVNRLTSENSKLKRKLKREANTK